MTATARTEYGSFQVYTNDHIGKTMLSGIHYEGGAVAEILSNCLNRAGIALDIGANIGAHTVPYAAHFRQVIAFEPQGIVADLLEKNTVHLPNVQVRREAAGHACLTVYIEGGEEAGDAVNYGSRAVRTAQKGQAVRMVPIDQFGYSDVRLVKIDTEGAEKLVFYGAKETIRRCKPVLFFEYDKINEFMRRFGVNAQEVVDFDLLEFLTDCGYRHFHRVGKKNILAV